MSLSFDLTSNGLLALSRASLTTLRAALMRDGGSAASYLQEAGYAGGDATWEAFTRWLAERTDIAPDALDVDAFESRATEFFRDAGWGTLEIGAISDTVATVDSPDWGEADPASALEHPGCHLTTGMFADLFGRVAGSPVAVLEVECRSAGAARCRFLIANPEFLEQVFDEMSTGRGYEEAIVAVTSPVS